MKTIETVIEGLRKAAIELEKLQVQATLGKAEAKDKYEEARKKFNADIQDIQNVAKEKYKGLKPMLESLQVQFALGKAEAKENFEKQRKKFSGILNDLEAFLKKQDQNQNK